MTVRTGRANTSTTRHTQLTLWDALRALIHGRSVPQKPAKNRQNAPKNPEKPRLAPANGPPPGAPATPMQRIYRDMAHDLPARYGITITRWRSSTSGVAILRKTNRGRWLREMEAPYPRGPVSAAVFCHEIAHHAIGVGSITPRCREEYAAWMWALDELDRRGVTITTAVRNRVYDALHHAVHRGLRRGLKQVPPELVPYLEPRPGRRSRSA